MNAFRSLRARLGMTQAAMAAALGMSQSNVSFYESGQEIRPEVAKKIIRLAADRGLTVTFDEIYGPTPSTSNQQEAA